MRFHGRATRVLMSVLAVGIVEVAALGDTLSVCWDGSGEYPTVQEAIDATNDGDEIVLCDGTYTGPGNKSAS